MQRIESIPVPKKYLEECCTNEAHAEPFDATNLSNINEININLLIQLVYFHTGLAPQDDIESMKGELENPDSPESVLFYKLYAIRNIIEDIKTKAGEITTNDYRIKMKNQLADEITKQVTALTLKSDDWETKINVARAVHERRQNRIMVDDIGRKKQAIEAACQTNDYLMMDLKLNEDPLYSPDMVQHLIRLRLQDPEIKNSYPPLEDQTAINKDNRIWLGLYELSDLKAPDLQVKRHQLRNHLIKKLSELTIEDRKKEICISIRVSARNNAGHYLMLSLFPDPMNNTKHIMRCVNSNRTEPDMKAGIPGELFEIATECQFDISTFKTIVLISQPTNHGCGPTHVEIVSAVMTQNCLYGNIPFDYTKQPTIENRSLTHEVLRTHTGNLIENPTTRKALIARGGEESVFRMVVKGENENVFGFIPPQIEYLKSLKEASIDRQEQLAWKPLIEAIDELKRYGEQLQNEDDRQLEGKKAVLLADEIKNKVNDFRKKKITKDEATQDLTNIIIRGKKLMGENRKFQDYIGPIILACTIIGIVIIIAHKLITGTFFLNPTKRKKLLVNIQEEAKKVKTR